MKIPYIVLVPFLVACLCGCNRKDEKPEKDFSSRAALSADVTCVVPSKNGDALLLGSSDALFSRFNPKDGSQERFVLPEFSEGWKTYDISELGPQEFLVAKRNNGIFYVRYQTDESGNRKIAHTSRLKLPSSPLPAKDTHYSVYSILPKDSMIVLGTSNGLAYITASEIVTLRSDTVATARFCAPIVHLRKNKRQFSQESVFFTGDSVLTVTDHGIYKIALRDFGDHNAAYQTFDGEMRCWDAEIVGDSVAVLWSKDQDNESNRLITKFSLSGKRGSTVPVDASITWIGLYGNQLKDFGEEGDFGCFRSATMLGDKFYFTKDGVLWSSHSGEPSANLDEQISFYDSGIALSNNNGIWDLREEKPKFVGEIEDVTGIRGISVSNDMLYMATAGGIYSVKLSNGMLAHNRSVKLVEANEHKNSDKVESIYASGDTLLIGTRNGLHSLLLSTGETRSYKFPALDAGFESPYIRRIMRDKDGGWLLQTLNHGVWRLATLNAQEAEPVNVIMPPVSVPSHGFPERPTVTWRTIMDNIMTILTIIMLLSLIMAGVLIVIQKRHRKKINILDLAVANERRAYHSQKEQLEKNIEDLRQRQDELAELRKKHEEAEKMASKEMGLPLKVAAEALKSRISEVGDSPLADLFKTYLAPIAEYLESDSPSHESISASAEAYRSLSRFCTGSLAAADTLINSIPENSVFTLPLQEFKFKYLENSTLGSVTIVQRLDRVVANYRLLKDLIEQVRTAIVSMCEECGDNAPEFYSEDLALLWNECILPASNKLGRYAICRGDLLAEQDVVTRKRTYIFTTITFYGCLNPVVDGKSLNIDARSLVRFENSARLGTIFNFWANQLSGSCMTYGAAGMPASVADLMWRAWLSDSSDDLARGIRLAYCKLHDIPMPADIEALLTGRTKGRPRKKV